MSPSCICVQSSVHIRVLAERQASTLQKPRRRASRYAAKKRLRRRSIFPSGRMAGRLWQASASVEIIARLAFSRNGQKVLLRPQGPRSACVGEIAHSACTDASRLFPCSCGACHHFKNAPDQRIRNSTHQSGHDSCAETPVRRALRQNPPPTVFACASHVAVALQRSRGSGAPDLRADVIGIDHRPIALS